MKILHISNNDSSGAGLCAYRLHTAMKLEGIDSRILVFRKTHNNDTSVMEVFKYRKFIYRCFHALLRKMGIYTFEYDRLVQMSQQNHTCYTRPVSPFDLSNHPWVLDADIIHLHWVDDFFDQIKFIQKIKKPIVWTIHDENLFYGISHYSNKIIDDNPLEIKYRELKRKMVANSHNLNFVLLSNFFVRKFAQTSILQKHRVKVIPNSVDCSKYKFIAKKAAQNSLGLKSDFVYFVFVAYSITDERKGLDKLIHAVDDLNKENDKYRIVAVGDNKGFLGHRTVIETGLIHDSHKMSVWFSAADYFVMPSLQEAFSQSPIEAMACGKPAIVFPVSGTEELITTKNGIVCEGFSKSDLLNGIKKALNKEFDSNEIRRDVSERFSAQTIVKEYTDFYKQIQ